MQETFNRVKALIIDEWGSHPSEVTPSARLTKDLGYDSLDKTALLMKVEDEFRISIPSEDFERIDTIEQIVKYVNDRKAKVG